MNYKLLFLLLLSIFLLSSCEQPEEQENILQDAYLSLTLDSELTATTLPSSIGDVDVQWDVSVDYVLDGYDVVPQLEDVTVLFTATLSYQEETMVKVFSIVVLADETLLAEQQAVRNAIQALLFDSMLLDADITLPTELNGVSISWHSSTPSVLSDGGVVTRPSDGSDNQDVVLTATFTYQGYTEERDYTFTILAETQTVIYQGYYYGADNLTGESLKTFLHDLIDDHTVVSYSGLWNALGDSDEDPSNANNVILLYSGRSELKSNNGGAVDEWNREHVWPKSHGGFDTDEIPGSDMHHIRPSDVTVNSERGNLDFDEGGSFIDDYTGALIDSKKDGDSFEPRDEVKGDVARMIFYMAVRYEGDDGYPDLELNNNVNNLGPYVGVLTVLLEWHFNDAPDAFELNRNNVIESYQGNRNPFIDHPEFASLIWS